MRTTLLKQDNIHSRLDRGVAMTDVIGPDLDTPPRCMV